MTLAIFLSIKVGVDNRCVIMDGIRNKTAAVIRSLDVGIMQGRLLPMRENSYQGFPGDNWAAEFALAKKAKLRYIEWVFDQATASINPLESKSGIREIKRVVEETDVKVVSLCANYFMTNRLIDESGLLNIEAVEKFYWLTKRAEEIGIIYIVLPILEESSLLPNNEFVGIVSIVDALLPSLEMTGVELLLETDIPAERLSPILEKINHPLVGVNYDIGNSASMGYNPLDELRILSTWIRGVHVKDRVKNGSTVPLGQGHADFRTCFRTLLENGFNRWLILEAARRDDISNFEAANSYRQFVEDQIHPLVNQGSVVAGV